MKKENQVRRDSTAAKLPAQTKTPAEKSAAKVSAQTKNREVNLKVLLPTIVLDCLNQATNHDSTERERFIKEAIREKLKRVYAGSEKKTARNGKRGAK